MSGTIRSRTEAQRDRHESDHARAGGLPIREYCRHCDHEYPCPDRVAADDTLTDLNNAPVYDGIVFYAPDAEPSEPTRSRLIPDPDSRGAA